MDKKALRERIAKCDELHDRLLLELEGWGRLCIRYAEVMEDMDLSRVEILGMAREWTEHRRELLDDIRASGESWPEADGPDAWGD